VQLLDVVVLDVVFDVVDVGGDAGGSRGQTGVCILLLSQCRFFEWAGQRVCIYIKR
jgi:hypothetical protein